MHMDGSTQELVIGSAFAVYPPSPGGAALLGLAGFAGLRRRR